MIKPTTIFDTYAFQYEEKFNQNPLGKYQRQQVHQELVRWIPPGSTILDVGCGPGSDFDFYRSLQLQVYAIDSSSAMIELARQKAAALQLNALIQQVSLEEFQPEKSYNAIILNFGVINVFHPLSPILSKLHSLLTTDGILIIVSMPPFHLFPLLEWLLTFRWQALFRRLFRRRAVLADGFQFYYYGQRAFTRRFRLIKAIHLCALLPSPDQYHRYAFARRFADVLTRADARLAPYVPDWLGGDHVCYVLKRKK